MAIVLLAACAAAVLALFAARRRAARKAGPRRPSAVRATPFAQKDIVVLGMRLRYVDEGSGPPLLLIPGHTSRIEEYDAVAAVLHGRYRVIVFDFPGSGYADKPDRPYGLAFYEDVALRALDALGVGRCLVAGGSLGGNLALRLAHRAPERFARVAAWGPGSAWEAMPRIAACMRAFHLAGRPFFWCMARIQSRYWFSKDWPGAAGSLRETFAYYREVLCPGFVRMYWDIAADQMGWSLFGIAAGIRQPALLLWGDRDHGLAMGEGVRRLHALMPASSLVVLTGAGHAIAAERPEELAARLDAFFSRETS